MTRSLSVLTSQGNWFLFSVRVGKFCLWGGPQTGPRQQLNVINKRFSFSFLFDASGTDDGSVRFWRLETGAGESFRTHENTVSALAAYRDREGSLTFASAGFDGAIIIWRAHAKDGLDRHQVRGEGKGEGEKIARIIERGLTPFYLGYVGVFPCFCTLIRVD